VPIPTVDQVNQLVAETYPATVGDGFRCVDIGEAFAVARWSYDVSLDRPGGLISGSTQFTICDSALWYLSFTVVGLQPMAVTSDLHITFLRPAMGGDLIAKAELIRAGRSRIFGEVRVWVEGAEERQVAHATGSYAILKSR
jgi:uncharacterized protein (TIGR00369 family)